MILVAVYGPNQNINCAQGLGRTVILTDYPAKFFVHESTQRRPPYSDGKLVGVVTGAPAAPNPHQPAGTLFAASGALLTDNVGLRIETGIVISLRWVQRKPRISSSRLRISESSRSKSSAISSFMPDLSVARVRRRPNWLRKPKEKPEQQVIANFLFIVGWGVV